MGSLRFLVKTCPNCKSEISAGLTSGLTDAAETEGEFLTLLLARANTPFSGLVLPQALRRQQLWSPFLGQIFQF